MKPLSVPNILQLSKRVGFYPILWICVFVSALNGVVTAQTNVGQQKEQSTQTSSPKKANVRGRVIYEDTRRPLRRVGVMLFDPATKPVRYFSAWTNGRGEFQFKEIPVGKYFVTVRAPGIIRADPYSSDDAEKELTSITADGLSQSEVVVRVRRGGAISGKVTYPDGDPVINASIKVLRKKDDKWVPVYVGGENTDRALTDERGVYRVSGLAPGEYLVGAAEQKLGIERTDLDSNGNQGTVLNRSELPPTYYAGVTTVSVATVLRLQSGEEQTGINISLVERLVRTISGVVTFATGDHLPIARARISLKMKGEEPESGSPLEEPVVNTDADGRFVFDEVYEGAYILTVAQTQQYRGFDDDRFASKPNIEIQKFVTKRLDLNVSGADVTDLIVEVSSGRRISGVVTTEAGKPLPRNVSVLLQPPSGEAVDYVAGQTQQDGSFTIEGVSPGRYFLRTAVRPNNDHYTKSVMHGSSDFTRQPLVIKEDEDVSNVRIVISSDVAVLSGRVLASDGKTPQTGVGVLFVSSDLLEQNNASRRLYGFTNADGSYRVSGAPGEYLAIIMRRGENWDQLRGNGLVSRAAKAQRVTLQPGENKLDLIPQ